MFKEDLPVRLAKHLDKLCNKYQLKKGVWAVGVSGGADSLALVYLLKAWADKAGIIVKALTVNHELRSEAAGEAKYVGELMEKAGIEHHILVWNGTKPVSGIEAAAREARYDLLLEWCRNNCVENLLIAHHKLDQAETFLMRLQRGSGVDGLSAMLPVTERAGVRLIRPLLDVLPQDLRCYLQDQKIRWVEDPSNQEDEFLRVRIRKAIPALEKELGFTVERLAATAGRMARVRDYLEYKTNEFMTVAVIDEAGGAVSVDIEKLKNEHEEIVLRVWSFLLRKVGDRIYGPKMEDVERLSSAALKNGFRGQTLCGCEVFNFNKRIWIIPEGCGDSVLKKQEWEAFCKNYPEYEKQKLPYKLRRIICHQFPGKY